MVKHYILARLISKLSLPSFKNCDMDKTAFADSRCIFNVSVKKSGDWFSAPLVPTMVGGRRSLHFWNYQS